MRRSLLAPVVLSIVGLVGCASESAEPAADDSDFSSNQATLLDFEFDAELETDSVWNEKQTIQDQLLYTIGHLNHDNSVGRLDNLELSNIQRTSLDGGKTKLSYHAKLPVAWGRKSNLPSTYELVLPRDNSFAGIQAFTEKYKHDCVDWGAHDVDSGSMWYYYRPKKSGCSIPDAEVVKVTATATKSALNTTNKYPEYHKVWEDDRLEVVAIFGKYENGGGAGVSGFKNFLSTIKGALGAGVVQTPAEIGADAKDVQFEATLADGKKVKVVALLVDAITSTWPGFQQRYEALTPTADIIAYNGHAGLGQNVRALARMGKWVSGKYQMFFMNGCDTFAYVDGSLAQTRASLNPDDPTGTKYMEFVTNAMPSFFSSMPNASTALVKGMLSYAQPKTYDQIFENIDRSEVVLVTGEEDNVFVPGMAIGSGGGGGGGGGGATEFTPFEESGSVRRDEEKKYSYDVPAGDYKIVLSGTGDADLYVRKIGAVDRRTYDCRPYKNGSAEECTVSLPEPGKLNVMVRGYGPNSTFKVSGTKR
ncbi:MAG: PPC domain-containing protein [Deltaproteobacteria bacterium]|nr:PPC domain-containing protein [Deltaproteobacteria bacterium]